MNIPQKIEYSEVSLNELVGFLEEVDHEFSPALSLRVSLREYAAKILKFAEVYGIYDDKFGLVGAFAVYANDQTSCEAYVSFIATATVTRGKGLGAKLMDCLVGRCRQLGMKYIKLEVSQHNQVAICLYSKFGFKVSDEQNFTTRSDASSMFLFIDDTL